MVWPAPVIRYENQVAMGVDPLQVLRVLGIRGPHSVVTKPSGEKWASFGCVRAARFHANGTDNNPSMAVSSTGRVFCFSCGFTGDMGDLLWEMRGLGYSIPKSAAGFVGSEMAQAPMSWSDQLLQGLRKEAEVSRPTVLAPVPFNEQWLDGFERAYTSIGEQVHPYLTGRQVSWCTAESLDLRYDRVQRRICFPVRGFDGNLYGLHGRAIDNSISPRYRMYRCDGHTNSSVWLGEEWVNFDRPVVVAESVFDLARVYEVYRNVVSPLTAALSKAKMGRLKNASGVVTLFDADIAGRRACKYLENELAGVSVTHATLPVGIADAGDADVAVIGEVLEACGLVVGNSNW